MAVELHTVAVLVGNPALSSILSATLAGTPQLRVRAFESPAALLAYLRLAPVEVLVLDLDDEEVPVLDLAASLHDSQVQPSLEMVALSCDISAGLKTAATAAGIGEILMKPMSPRYLVERIASRVGRQVSRPSYRSPCREDWSQFGDNVVPLFAREPAISPP